MTPQPVATRAENDPLNYFEVFGLEPAFALDTALLESRYFELARLLHPDRYQTRPEALRHSLARQSLINDAFKILKSEPSRRAHMLELFSVDTPSKKQAPPLEIAEEWFEVQESLLEGELTRVLGFRQMLSVKRAEVLEEISEASREFDRTKSEQALTQIAELTGLNQYLDSLERDLESKLGKARNG